MWNSQCKEIRKLTFWALALRRSKLIRSKEMTFKTWAFESLDGGLILLYNIIRTASILQMVRAYHLRLRLWLLLAYHLEEVEVTSWLVSADDFSSRVARGANERVSAVNEWVQRLLATSEEKSDKRTNHEVICLFYTYWDFKRTLRKKIVMKTKFISNRVIKLNDGMTKSN